MKFLCCCRQQHCDPYQDLEEGNDRTMLEKQLESSEGQLQKVLLEGKELVSLFTERYMYTHSKN
jgi:hypothetical protein